MAWIWTALALIAIVFLFNMMKNKHKRLPPGPRGIPILDNMHMLGNLPHRALHALAKKYGPIMYMRLGFVPAIVVSSPQAAEQFLKTHDLDMMAGSMDTSSSSIDWAVAELIRHPRVMKKLQSELEKVVGMERMVEESDLESLEYLNMSMEDCTVNGFYIPKKSSIIVNAWAIGRDPDSWTNADEFLPERFIEGDIDFRGKHFQYIPFGSGRRGCPGMQLGLTVVRFVVAQLVHCFDWELPDGMLPSELDMTEEFGLAIPRAKHLVAIPTYRLCQ
ncbi:hypothetical protein PVL29_027017 [Vitis rotundifolia]|uniref:Cytochrome P450 n=1 Tax=Vitis rotundifolia TaxID=103349 RepID=A0AA38YI14_VITRO|nr:hypothetical protein PVL29_027017 [Vitis rotundifolia]